MQKEFYSAGIIGIGVNIPEEIRLNSYWDNIEISNSPKERNRLFTGIEGRRILPKDVASSDVEAISAQRAIEDAGLKNDDIDLIMVHSMLQDNIIPGNASLVQHKLGLKSAAAWNIDTCCSSFVTMITTASHLIAMGTFNNIVIVTSVIHSRLIQPTHYLSPCAGDGAAAIVMGRVTEGKGYISSHLLSNGALYDGFKVRESIEIVENKAYPTLEFLTNDEKLKIIGRNSINDMQPIMEKAIEKANLTADDIDFMFTHQPAYWVHDAWRDSLGIPPSKSYHAFSKYGNLASTSIPICIYEARQLGKIKDGDTLLLASSGAGENFAAVVLKWGI